MKSTKIFLAAGSFLLAAGALFAFKAESKKHVGAQFFYLTSDPQPRCVTQTCTTFNTQVGNCFSSIPPLYTTNQCQTQLTNPPTNLYIPSGI